MLRIIYKLILKEDILLRHHQPAGHQTYRQIKLNKCVTPWRNSRTRYGGKTNLIWEFTCITLSWITFQQQPFFCFTFFISLHLVVESPVDNWVLYTCTPEEHWWLAAVLIQRRHTVNND
jgi:hypothetical protein